MEITASAISLNVKDPDASAASFKPAALAGHDADGLLVVFVVSDIDAEYERLAEAGIEFTTPIETEDWGERYFQVTDPNGVVIQLVQWMTDPEQDDS